MWLNACGKFPDHLAAGRVDLLGQRANIRFQSPHCRFGRVSLARNSPVPLLIVP
jgi:hypothetical protein